MSRRVRQIRFVGHDDEGYRAHCAGHALESRRLGPSMGPSATMRAALLLEEIVRRRLGQVIPLEKERILACELQEGRFGYKPAYFEIDAVSGCIGAALQLFEIKATYSSKYAQRGRKQLERAKNIIVRRQPRSMITLVLVWVETGEAPCDVQWTNFDADTLRGHRGNQDAYLCIRIPGDEAWGWAASVGVEVDQNLREQAQREANEARLLRDERQALREAGVPEAEWPAALRAQPQRRPSGSYSTSTTIPESALSIAFRRAAVGRSKGQRAPVATTALNRATLTSLPASAPESTKEDTGSVDLERPFRVRRRWWIAAVVAGGLLAWLCWRR